MVTTLGILTMLTKQSQKLDLVVYLNFPKTLTYSIYTCFEVKN